MHILYVKNMFSMHNIPFNMLPDVWMLKILKQNDII